MATLHGSPPKLHGCPHCSGLKGFCCACQGTRLVDEADVERWVAAAWAVPGCRCPVCTQLRQTWATLIWQPGDPETAPDEITMLEGSRAMASTVEREFALQVERHDANHRGAFGWC